MTCVPMRQLSAGGPIGTVARRMVESGTPVCEAMRTTSTAANGGDMRNRVTINPHTSGFSSGLRLHTRSSPFASSQFNPGGAVQGAVQGAGDGGGFWGAVIGGLAGALTPSQQENAGGAAVPGGDQFVGGGAPTPCPSGTFKIPGTNRCVDLIPGGPTSGAGVVLGDFEPIHGQYGVGVAPAAQERVVRTCPDGMVLGRDGVCYNRSVLRKSERAHPPSRKPLMTAGDLNAISRASRVAGKLKRKNKELKKLGLLK